MPLLRRQTLRLMKSLFQDGGRCLASCWLLNGTYALDCVRVGPQIKDEPLKVIECLQLLPEWERTRMYHDGSEAGSSLPTIRFKKQIKTGWKEVKTGERIIDLQSWLSMLQCQNYTLADQVSIFQLVAEKAAIKAAQVKYKKGARHG